MSLVIAEVKDGVVYMGADTQTTIGTSKRNFLCESNFKILKMPYGVLIGSAGSAKRTDLLCSHKEWFEILEHQKLSKELLVTKIVPKFYEELKKLNWLKEEHPVDSDTSLLIAQEDRLFNITRHLDVFTVPKFDAIGCGDQAALAVYELMRGAPVRDKMLKALRLADQMDNAVGAPFIFIDTKNLEFEKVEE